MTKSSQYEDKIVAGGQLEVADTVTGVLIAAGGTVEFTGVARTDVIAAGGTLEIDGSIEQNAILAGGTIELGATVAGKVIGAGGTIRIKDGASVAGGVDLTASSVDVAGTVGDNSEIAAGSVTVSGTVKGDMEIAADTLELKPGAVIDGDLRFRGSEQPAIPGDATVTGQVTFEQASRLTGMQSSLVFLGLGLLVLGVVVMLAFPAFSTGAGRRLREMPVRCVAAGLGVVIVTPMVVVGLFMTVVGGALALALIFAYALLLSLGLVFTGFGGGQWIADRWGAGRGPGTVRRLIAFALALVAFVLIGLIPVVGGYLLLCLLVVGVGSIVVQLLSRRSHPAAA